MSKRSSTPLEDKRFQKVSLLSPAPGYLLLEPLEGEQTDGVVIAGVEETPQRAKVLAVGEEILHISGDRYVGPPAKKGDVVVHSAFGFENIRCNGDEYRLCPFDKILAVFKK